MFILQIIGMLFGAIMCYFTFLNYKRNEYQKTGLIMWILIWIGFIILAGFPTMVYGIMEFFQVERTMDFYVLVGFFTFSIIIFQNYLRTKKNEKRLTTLTTKIAQKIE